jgi:hypothetical protein
MGHPDQHTPDDHRTSNREDAPEPNIREELEEDLDPQARRELEERADTGSNVRTDEPDEGRTGEIGHTYMGRTMDDDLKADKRPRDEEDLEG